MARVTRKYGKRPRGVQKGQAWVLDHDEPVYLDGVEAQYAVCKDTEGSVVAYVLDLGVATLLADAINAQVVAVVDRNEAGQVYLDWRGKTINDFVGKALCLSTKDKK